MKSHATGWTIVLAAVFAVGLSFAPIPDAWRPIPSLDRSNPAQTLARAVLPSKSRSAPQDALVAAPAQVAETELGGADDAQVANALELDDEQAEAEGRDDSSITTPLPPAATLGAVEARSVRRLERWAEKLGAKHVDIENASALEPFFEALEATQRGERKEPVRVLHLGDSQIASDYISDTVRRRLQLRYGSAGPGFLFVDRPTRFAGRKVRTGEATDGWEIVKLTDKDRPGLLGVTGVRFTAAKGDQRSSFKVAGARTAELAFVTEPNGGTLEAFADDAPTPIGRIFTRFSDPTFAQSKIHLPEGTKTLSLVADGPVSLFGVSLESAGPGIVYDSVGLPGAMYEVYLRAPEETFVTQLRHRDPSLVILMLGGNEAYEINRGWQTVDTVKKNATALIDRIQTAVPQASCLVLSPMEAGIRTIGGEIEPRPHTEEVGAALHEIALAKGCAFWDLREAIGGEGSVARWLSKGLFNQDLIHPLPAGAEIIGHLLDFALEKARAARPNALGWTDDAPGLADAEDHALQRTFGRLDAVAHDPKQESVRIVQLGASHTASHFFTDVVRADLTKRFGAAGRGFVAAGRPSNRLTPSGVARELRGDWQVIDARERPSGEPFGLTGIRAIGQPNASLSIRFGEAEDGGNAPAQLSLYYLESPEMGTLRVRIDGDEVATLAPNGAPTGDLARAAQRQNREGRTPEPVRPALAHAPERPAVPATDLLAPSSGSRAKVVQFAVSGTSHQITVENLGPGLATILGASMDQPQGGVIYDAIGLPGATASVLNGYEPTSFVEQLQARHADLYVLFFGTNESALPSLTAEELVADNTRLLKTLRSASPDAECLIIGPTDRDAPYNSLVVKTLRQVAVKEGCAFWSARAAMGGPGSMTRWQSIEPPLAHEDGIHLTPDGYAALAHAFTDDLLRVKRTAEGP